MNWLKTVQQAREKHNDQKGIIDAFLVDGSLQKWIGQSSKDYNILSEKFYFKKEPQTFPTE